MHEIEVPPATDEEIYSTIKVMGGQDWERWVAHLQAKHLLNPGFKTVAYTYIGSDLTWPVYWEGAAGKSRMFIGQLQTPLERALRGVLAWRPIAVLKAVVTQASSAIPRNSAVPFRCCSR